MKCRTCSTVIDQTEADRAAQILGPGHETMCVPCAESIRMTMMMTTKIYADMATEEQWDTLVERARSLGEDDDRGDALVELLMEAQSHGCRQVLYAGITTAMLALWHNRGHGGRDAEMSLERMAQQSPPSSGADCDALIDRWECEWLAKQVD